MNTFLWVLQGILALVFLAAGGMKAFMPAPKLEANDNMSWIRTAGIEQARIAGFAEILGALGLVLPGLLGILVALTPLAALGLVVIMGLAFRLHRKRDERQGMIMTGMLGLLAAIVVIGRLIEPIPA